MLIYPVIIIYSCISQKKWQRQTGGYIEFPIVVAWRTGFDSTSFKTVHSEALPSCELFEAKGCRLSKFQLFFDFPPPM